MSIRQPSDPTMKWDDADTYFLQRDASLYSLRGYLASIGSTPDGAIDPAFEDQVAEAWRETLLTGEFELVDIVSALGYIAHTSPFGEPGFNLLPYTVLTAVRRAKRRRLLLEAGVIR